MISYGIEVSQLFRCAVYAVEQLNLLTIYFCNVSLLNKFGIGSVVSLIVPLVHPLFRPSSLLARKGKVLKSKTWLLQVLFMSFGLFDTVEIKLDLTIIL